MEYKWPLGNTEKWKDIPNIPYQISNLGRIRRFCRYSGKSYNEHFKLIKGEKNSCVLSGKKYNKRKLMHDIWGIDSIESLPNEVWVDIIGCKSFYQVSNFGRIKSVGRYIECINGKKNYKYSQIIKPTKINSGYLSANLHLDNGHVYRELVHRIVAKHFLPNPNKFEEVNHKDENKLNNNVENLEWCTREYNSIYGTCQERRIKTRLKNNNGKYGVQRKNNRNTTIKE